VHARPFEKTGVYYFKFLFSVFLLWGCLLGLALALALNVRALLIKILNSTSYRHFISYRITKLTALPPVSVPFVGLVAWRRGW